MKWDGQVLIARGPRGVRKKASEPLLQQVGGRSRSLPLPLPLSLWFRLTKSFRVISGRRKEGKFEGKRDGGEGVKNGESGGIFFLFLLFCAFFFKKKKV